MYGEIDILFALLRSALEGKRLELSAPVDASRWWHLFRLSQQNHVAALVADALPPDTPREVLIPWMAERQKAEGWYNYQHDIQEEIVGLMSKHGIKTLVLKGTNTAQHYPVPETREFGDLDLYFYDKHDEADRAARTYLRVRVNNNSHHHSKYNYRGVTVESHYDFLNIHYPPSNRQYEKLLKELAPSPTFEVLFLLRHMAGHFAASRITLRDVADMALTCQALKDNVDWPVVLDAIRQYGMTAFAAAIGSIAKQRLGKPTPICMDGDSAAPSQTQLQRIEHDIVYGSIADHDNDGIDRLGWKVRRWRALTWKRRMVYNDNPVTLAISSLASHTLKPHSILHKQ